jgi:cephalosporin hydroxylase
VSDRVVIEEFHRLFFQSMLSTWANTRWLGVAVEKPPSDLWVYQEILSDIRPDVIVESGTRFGGSALFLASVCDLLDHGRVVTVDLEDLASNESVRRPHGRITYVTGSSSTSQAALDAVRREIEGAETVMVILDSDHSMTHVTDELRLYAPLVTEGSYLIVEDTQINGHPILPDEGPGPMEALAVFLRENSEFVPDVSREKFLVTFNPRGFLKRVGCDSAAARVLLAEAAAAEAALNEQEARERLSAQAGLLSELDQRIVMLESAVQQRQANLDSVTGSASWRLTAPLRAAKNALRRP